MFHGSFRGSTSKCFRSIRFSCPRKRPTTTATSRKAPLAAALASFIGTINDDAGFLIDRTGNRLAVSIVLAALVLGSSLMLNAKLEPLIPNTELSIMGLMGTFAAACLAIWLVIAILRSGRL